MSSAVVPKVRLATREDSDEIYRLLLELAEFVKLREAIHITPEDFNKDGFGDKSCFRCLVVDDVTTGGEVVKGRLIAQCTFYTTFSSRTGRCMNLEDIYVTPTWRNRGIGHELFTGVCKVAVEEKCSSMTWEVLGWNQSARQFYDKHGAYNRKLRHGTDLWVMDLPEIQKLAQS